MLFPLIVFKDSESAYGGLLPDFNGCYPIGQTLDSLLHNVQDAVETWMLGENPALFPRPSSLEDVQKLETVQGRPLLWVDVDTSFLDTVPQHINMTVPHTQCAAILATPLAYQQKHDVAGARPYAKT